MYAFSSTIFFLRLLSLYCLRAAFQFDHMQLSGIEPGKFNEYDTAHRSAVDMKTLQYLQDQAQRLATIISLNMEVLESFASLAERLGKLFPDTIDVAGILTQFSGELERVKREHRFSLISSASIINRARSVAEQVSLPSKPKHMTANPAWQLRDTISLRNNELANQHAAGMVELSRASSRETQVLKTLTVLALIFVPASYVAVGTNAVQSWSSPLSNHGCTRTFFRWDTSLYRGKWAGVGRRIPACRYTLHLHSP